MDVPRNLIDIDRLANQLKGIDVSKLHHLKTVRWSSAVTMIDEQHRAAPISHPKGQAFTYAWDDTIPHTEAYLLPPLQQLITAALAPQQFASAPPRLLDLGCGNGALCRYLSAQGYAVEGIEPSPSGIASARQLCAHVPVHQATASPSELARLQLDPFDLVISTEVVEHCYSPREWAACAFQALRPDG